MVPARFAVYFGDRTNNDTEYAGALAVLRHAVAQQCARVVIYGDSKLVISQLLGSWRCKANNLVWDYAEGLELVRRLHDVCHAGLFLLGHVYLKFNAEADALASTALDQRRNGDTTVVNDAWFTMQVQLI